MTGLRMRFGGAALLAAVTALVLVTAQPAGANPRLCRQLEAELASAGNGGTRASKFDNAIMRQREQMAIAREQAQDAGCGFALIGRAVRQCAALNATIDRMERNLDKLERQRGRMAGGGGRSRARVLAALEANGCRDDAVAERPLEDEPREAMADPDGHDRARTPLEMMLDDAEAEEDQGLQAHAGENYQTMCVRTCDGYFFPISYASTISDFDRDLRNCETSCPGTAMQVFFGPSGIDEPASMVSTATGRRYSEIPTAFLHQRTDVPQPPGCGCNPKKDFSVIAGTKQADRPMVWPPETPATPAATDRNAIPDDAGADQQPGAPVPAQHPDEQGADIAATAPGGEAPPFEIAPADIPPSSIVTIPLPQAAQPKPAEPEAPAANSESTKPEKPAERKVRVVGPAFLPDPEAEAVRPVQDPTSSP